jgi:cysteine desulfurase
MFKPTLYADYNATVPLRQPALAAMLHALEVGGNPSSIHANGRAAKAILEGARETLGAELSCRPRDIVFTSGASEALHMALDSAHAARPARVFVSAMEHDAAFAYAKHLFPACELIAPNANGMADLEQVSARLDGWNASAQGRPLIVLQAANNETGVLQDLPRAANLTRECGGYLLVDGVQTLGKCEPRDFIGFGDWTVLSSHKAGGPLGAGALILAPGAPEPLNRPGGGQESGRRAGTENVAAIAGFAAAVQAAHSDLTDAAGKCRALRDQFELLVQNALPQAFVIGQSAQRLANTSCVALPGWRSETLLIALDLAGARVSAGAACSSGKAGPSRALLAIAGALGGFDPAHAASAIRVSFGWANGPHDGERLAELYIQITTQRRSRAGAGETNV